MWQGLASIHPSQHDMVVSKATVPGKALKWIPISKSLSKQGKTKQKYVPVPDYLGNWIGSWSKSNLTCFYQGNIYPLKKQDWFF